MKKIICGKKYDTDTAKELASNVHGCSRDFNFFCEVLYRKNNGEYFIHGYGGPASKYRNYAGGTAYQGGEVITPLTDDEAKAWSERYMTVSEYEDEFGEVDE